MTGPDRYPSQVHAPRLTRAARGRFLPTTEPAYGLAREVHGHLAVITSIGQTDEDLLVPDSPFRQVVERSLAGLLLQHADCDHLAYAGMLVQDHIEAWENDGIGLPLDELTGLIDELLEGKPHRHFRLVITFDTGRGDGQTETRRVRVNDAGQEDLTKQLRALTDQLVDGEVSYLNLSVHPGRYDA